MPPRNSLKDIVVANEPFSGNIVVAKMSKKDARFASEKRDALMEVMNAVVNYFMHDSLKGSSQCFYFGDDYYRITCELLSPEETKRAIEEEEALVEKEEKLKEK